MEVKTTCRILTPEECRIIEEKAIAKAIKLREGGATMAEIYSQVELSMPKLQKLFSNQHGRPVTYPRSYRSEEEEIAIARAYLFSGATLREIIKKYNTSLYSMEKYWRKHYPDAKYRINKYTGAFAAIGERGKLGPLTVHKLIKAADDYNNGLDIYAISKNYKINPARLAKYILKFNNGELKELFDTWNKNRVMGCAYGDS